MDYDDQDLCVISCVTLSEGFFSHQLPKLIGNRLGITHCTPRCSAMNRCWLRYLPNECGWIINIHSPLSAGLFFLRRLHSNWSVWVDPSRDKHSYVMDHILISGTKAFSRWCENPKQPHQLTFLFKSSSARLLLLFLAVFLYTIFPPVSLCSCLSADETGDSTFR